MKSTFQCARYNVVKFRPEVITDKTVLRLGASLSIEQTEGGGMIIGGTREFAGYEEQNTFEAIELMMQRAARFFPVLKNVSVIRFFSGFRPFTPDGMPLQRVKGLRGFFMAAGREGTGLRCPELPESWLPSRSCAAEKAPITSMHSARTDFYDAAFRRKNPRMGLCFEKILLY